MKKVTLCIQKVIMLRLRVDVGSTDIIVDELINSFKQRYQEGLENIMRWDS